jgi:hypothetical protein
MSFATTSSGVPPCTKSEAKLLRRSFGVTRGKGAPVSRSTRRQARASATFTEGHGSKDPETLSRSPLMASGTTIVRALPSVFVP